jgi:hypothetical protein
MLLYVLLLPNFQRTFGTFPPPIFFEWDAKVGALVYPPNLFVLLQGSPFGGE